MPDAFDIAYQSAQMRAGSAPALPPGDYSGGGASISVADPNAIQPAPQLIGGDTGLKTIIDQSPTGQLQTRYGGDPFEQEYARAATRSAMARGGNLVPFLQQEQQLGVPDLESPMQAAQRGDPAALRQAARLVMDSSQTPPDQMTPYERFRDDRIRTGGVEEAAAPDIYAKQRWAETAGQDALQSMRPQIAAFTTDKYGQPVYTPEAAAEYVRSTLGPDQANAVDEQFKNEHAYVQLVQDRDQIGSDLVRQFEATHPGNSDPNAVYAFVQKGLADMGVPERGLPPFSLDKVGRVQFTEPGIIKRAFMAVAGHYAGVDLSEVTKPEIAAGPAPVAADTTGRLDATAGAFFKGAGDLVYNPAQAIEGLGQSIQDRFQGDQYGANPNGAGLFQRMRQNTAAAQGRLEEFFPQSAAARNGELAQSTIESGVRLAPLIISTAATAGAAAPGGQGLFGLEPGSAAATRLAGALDTANVFGSVTGPAYQRIYDQAKKAGMTDAEASAQAGVGSVVEGVINTYAMKFGALQPIQQRALRDVLSNTFQGAVRQAGVAGAQDWVSQMTDFAATGKEPDVAQSLKAGASGSITGALTTIAQRHGGKALWEFFSNAQGDDAKAAFADQAAARSKGSMSEAEARQVLGIDPNAELSPDLITKAYREQALRTHPDQPGGGDEAAFMKVANAAASLRDLATPSGAAAAQASPSEETPAPRPPKGPGGGPGGGAGASETPGPIVTPPEPAPAPESQPEPTAKPPAKLTPSPAVEPPATPAPTATAPETPAPAVAEPSGAMTEDERTKLRADLAEEKRLRRTDPLTGAPNIIKYREDARQIFHEADASNEHVAVVETDIGGLKVMNTVYGHAGGDEMLKMAHEAMREELRTAPQKGRPEDYAGSAAYRVGGDEFPALLRNVKDQAGVKAAMDRVNARFDKMIATKFPDLPPEARPFIAFHGAIRTPGDARSIDALRQEADAGVEAHKSAMKAGRNIPEGRTELLKYIQDWRAANAKPVPPTPLRGPKGSPVPMPPLGDGVERSKITIAWNVVSARYPKIAAAVKRIEIIPNLPENSGKVAAFNPVTGVLKVKEGVPLRLSTLAHEFTHVAQMIRGTIPLEDTDIDSAARAAVEEPASRRGAAANRNVLPVPSEQDLQQYSPRDLANAMRHARSAAKSAPSEATLASTKGGANGNSQETGLETDHEAPGGKPAGQEESEERRRQDLLTKPEAAPAGKEISAPAGEASPPPAPILSKQAQDLQAAIDEMKANPLFKDKGKEGKAHRDKIDMLQVFLANEVAAHNHAPAATEAPLPAPESQAEAGRSTGAGEVATVPVSSLHVDPERFQFKAETDNESGTTGLLKTVKTFDPQLAGVIGVWRDPADDKTYVVNGHHRFELAQRTGQKKLNVLFLNAANAKEARAVGALVNIAEGRGTAMDAARFLRDSGLNADDLRKKGISLTEKKVEDGLSLSRLSDPLFHRVAIGELSEPAGIAIGKALEDPTEQLGLVRLLEAQAKKGKALTPDEISELARFVKAAPSTTQTEASLFGEDVVKKNLAVEKARLSAWTKRQLRKDKKLFGTVARPGNAQALAKGGNQIDQETSKAIAEDAATAEWVFDKLSTQKGPVADALNDAARSLANGEPFDAVAQALQASVRSAVREVIAPGKGERAGRVQAGEPGARSGAEESTPAAAGEPGELGEPQAPAVAEDRFYTATSTPQVGLHGQPVFDALTGSQSEFFDTSEPAPKPESPAAKATGKLFGDGDRRNSSLPAIRKGGTAATSAGTRAQPAGYASTPPQTLRGGKLLRAIGQDPKGDKVGPRSIVEYVVDLVQSRLLVGRTQTSKKHPAHYLTGYHLIRSQAGGWNPNFHEAGHALSAILAERHGLAWGKLISPMAVALTHMPDSMASDVSPEEGVAEFIRRYIVAPGSIPRDILEKTDAFLEQKEKAVWMGLRDAHRAWAAHSARDFAAQLRSYSTDRGPKPPVIDQVKGLWQSFLFNVMSPEVAIDRVSAGMFRALKEVSLERAKAFDTQIRDTAADYEAAFQSLVHIPQEVSRALFGADKGTEGIRVLSTGAGFKDLAPSEMEKLAAGGFMLPEEPASKHGEWIHLNKGAKFPSMRSIQLAVGDDWNAFETYGQMRAAVHRYEKAGHRYPGLMEGFTPQVVRPWLAKQELAHPEWKDAFRGVNDYMDQLLLVSVLSGELDADAAVRIKDKWEDYWPLPRQVEDRPVARGSRGAEPSAGIRRAFGSDLPFRSLLDAVETRTKMAIEAYYQNRLILCVVNAGKAMMAMKDIPLPIRAAGAQLMLPLRLEVAKVATLSVPEQQKIIADYLNEQRARESGIKVEELPPTDRLRPDDINISGPGIPLFRAQRPRAVRIVAPFKDGKRAYFQVTDPLLFDLFARTRNIPKALATVSHVMTTAFAPVKEAITNNLFFAVGNVPRDAMTAMFMGSGGKSLIPGFYLGMGLVARLKGGDLDAAGESEMLSRALEGTTTKAHRTLVEMFLDELGRGVRVPGWTQMSLLEKAAEAPGQAVAAVMKPINMLNWITGQVWLSHQTESLPREGAYAAARAAGASAERAQLEYDRITGNYGQKPGNPVFGAMWRMAGFLNPYLQIQQAQYKRFFNYNRSVAARSWMSLGYLAALGAAAAALNFLLTSRKDRERMKERPDHERMSTMAIMGKVRIPFEYGLPGAAASYGWNAVEGMLLKEPIRGDRMARELLRRSSDLPGFQDLLPPYIKTAIELELNHSFWTGQEIEPDWMKKAFPNNPEERALPDTPKTYKALASWMGTSPVRVRYAVQQLFSSEMDDLVRAVEMTSDEKLRPKEAADVPLAGRRLVREPKGFLSQSVKDVADLDTQFDSIKKTLDDAKSMDLDPAEVHRLDGLAAKLDQLGEAHKAMLDVEKMWRAVKAQEKLDHPDQALVDRIERLMVDRAREALHKAALDRGGE